MTVLHSLTFTMVGHGPEISETEQPVNQKCVKLHSTSVFIQPAFVVSMLQTSDPDGFNDRQLFVCPQEVEFKYNELEIPMDESVPNLTLIFRILRHVHAEKEVCYKLSDSAFESFIVYPDQLCMRKQSIVDDEERRGILSKVKGQYSRLAMVFHALHQALSLANTLQNEGRQDAASVQDACEEWSTIIAEDYFISQKFQLMPPEIKISECLQPLPLLEKSSLLTANDSYVAKFLTYKLSEIHPSDVTQYRLMPPLPLTPDAKNKYPAESAKTFM